MHVKEQNDVKKKKKPIKNRQRFKRKEKAEHFFKYHDKIENSRSAFFNLHYKNKRYLKIF